MKSDAEGSAAFYGITNSDYLEYRGKLYSDAIRDPIVRQRLERAASLEEINKIIKAEVDEKLKIYREVHGLDENGNKK